MSTVAGIDFGTQSVRVSIFDSDRGRLGSGTAAYLGCGSERPLFLHVLIFLGKIILTLFQRYWVKTVFV